MRNMEDILKAWMAEEALTSEEKQQLEKWLTIRSGQDLMGLIDELKQGTGLYTKLKEDPEANFSAIKVNVNRIRGKRKRVFQWWARISAVVLLLISMLFIFYPYRKGEQLATLSEDRASSKSIAILTRADGTTYTLHAEETRVEATDHVIEFTEKNKTLFVEHLTATDTIGYNTVTVPLGGEYKMVLSDGTRIFLNSGSEIVFPTLFSGDKREIILKGEAFFDVSPDPDKPFIVTTPEMTAVVLGTSFNLKCYGEITTQTATLESGKLLVTSGGENFILNPGQQLFYRKGEKPKVKEVDTKLFTSWKDGYYFFKEATIGDIMETLCYWYNVKVVYQDNEVISIPFTGRLKRYDDISVLLETFAATGYIKFSKTEETIEIGKK